MVFATYSLLKVLKLKLPSLLGKSAPPQVILKSGEGYYEYTKNPLKSMPDNGMDWAFCALKNDGSYYIYYVKPYTNTGADSLQNAFC